MEKTITIDDNIFMLEEDGVYCGHLANMIISGKYEIEFGGMSR